MFAELNALAAYVLPIVGLPVLFALGSYTTFLRFSLALATFHFLFGVLAPRSPLTNVLELPLLLGYAYLFYSLAPGLLVSIYATALEYAEPVLLAIEGWRIVVLIFFISRIPHAHIAKHPVWAKGCILAIAGGCYVCSGALLYVLASHANISMRLSWALAVVSTLLVVILFMTLRIDRGIISDSAMLSLFVLYVLWMAVEQADDRPSQGVGITASLSYLYGLLVSSRDSLFSRAFAPLMAAEVIVSMLVSCVALLSLPFTLKVSRFRVTDLGALRRLVLGQLASYTRVVFVVVYTHVLAMRYGHFLSQRSVWRLAEAAVALTSFTVLLIFDDDDDD